MVWDELSRFSVIWVGSVLSEPSLRDFNGFYMIWTGSAWSELVFLDLRWFWAIWVGSVWSVMVLRDLSEFCMIWVGSAWSQNVRCELSRFCVIWASTFLSRLAFKNFGTALNYRFFRRSTEFRKWSVFLQIFIRNFEIFGFFKDFDIFWFFSTFFIVIGNDHRFWPCSSWTANSDRNT